MFDGSKLMLYANGEKEYEIIANGNIPQGITWIIGERKNGGGENGRFGIDEFALWETSLTPEEINAIYNRGSGLDVSDDSGNYQSSNQLQMYWNFNQAGGNSIYDQSGNFVSGNFNGTWDIRQILEKYIFSNEKITSDSSGKNWVAEYQIKDGDVVDGAMEFQITGFQDIAGNALLSPSILTEDDHQKSVAVDTNNPRVLTTSIASTNTNIDPNLGANTLLAKTGDTITVKFTTNDRIKDPKATICLLYTSPSPRDQRGSRMPSSA